MSILITGNKGFIGSGLVGDGIDLKDGVDIVSYRSKKKYDVVIHTAAKISVTESMKDPMEYVRTNVIGTMNMLKEHPEAHFIYLSTAGVYGEGLEHTVDSPIRPDSVYSVTKYTGECAVRMMAKSWAILRLTNVIGEGERGEPNVYQVFKKADVLPVFGDGLQTRDFIHVNEVRKVIMSFAQGTMQVPYNQIVNVGSGKSKTVLEVAREFDKPVRFFPARPGEIRNFGVKDAFNYFTESQRA